jgi:hypothetical protein
LGTKPSATRPSAPAASDRASVATSSIAPSAARARSSSAAADCEPHRAAGAVEEHESELGLEAADALADGGGDDVQPLRSAAEVQLFADGHEGLEVADVHARLPRRDRHLLDRAIPGRD